jgi:RNA polymerase sigma-70 factor, ECF subfamily
MAEAEREAVAALQRGDVAGLGTLVRLHQVRALRTAYAITGDQTSAEDAVADAFVLVYEHIAQFDPARPFAPWFYRIVANRA